MQFLTPRYDPWLVAESIAIASFACYVAINLAGRAGVAGTSRARAWWLGGSMALGSGIWAMHFVGMLAFALPIALGYGSLLTGLSWVAAVAVSLLTLALAARPGLGRTRFLVGAATMGTGIVVMHYTGMAALDMAPGIVWDAALVAASLAVAVLASGAALHIFSWLRPVAMGRSAARRALAAFAMGLAISAMHYTGMAAASFPVGSVCRSAGVLAGSGLGMLIAGTAVALLAVTLLTSILDAATRSRLAQQAAALRAAQAANDEAQRELAHARERHRQQLALQAQDEQLDMHRQVLDSVSEAIVVKGPNARILWANRAFRDYHGMSNAQLQGLLDAPLVTPGSALQSSADEARVFATGAVLDIPEEAAIRFDGAVQYWHTVKSPIFGSGGEVVATVGVSRDITADKQAREALRASQAFLDQTGRIGGVGGWSYDLATQTLAWTDQTCRLHDVAPGHRPTLAEAVGAFAAAARPDFEAAIRACIARGVGLDLELPLLTASGRALWVRVVAEPEIVGGRTLRLVGAIQDITARRAIETELGRKTGLLTSVLEHVPCGLSAFDAELKFLASNREFRRLLDLPDALLDRPDAGLEDVLRFNQARGDYGAQDPNAILQRFLDAAGGSRAAYAAVRTRPDGSVLEIRGAPMPGGGLVLTHNDISARHQAEQALHRQTERLRLAADSAGIGVWEHDPVRGTIEWDDWMYRIYGARRRDDVQPLDQWSTHLHPDDADRVQTAMRAALQGEARFKIEFRICRRDGEIRHLQAAAHVEHDAAGRPVRMTGVNIDVTPQRRSEEELREAKHAAESANLAKSQFLANMSHEIRTPMSAVLGMLTLLRRTGLTPRQADYAAKTDGAARALLGLLDEILDFSKIEAGRMTLEPRPFRIDHLLRDLSVVLSASLGCKDVDLLFDIDPALPTWLLGDAMRLRQVLINLGGNASKFTARGEVVLAVTVVGREPAGVTLEIGVRDTGIGIAPENQARIFGGFTQAEASTTRRFGGTGLGLAISQRLVALMGGELGLDSVAGVGSRFHFRITLPCAADPAEGSADAEPAGPLRALLVDDNPHARELLERLGRSLGWALDVADSGERALALLHARADAGTPCEAVFVDARMPGMDGWQTCRRLRESGAPGSVPIILMLTAHDRESVARRSRAEQALADGYLIKPVTASMLFDALVDARAAMAQAHPSSPASRRADSGSRRLAGLRLLVAEDNLNNQQVARELLEDEGASVQIADHGQAAVAVLSDATETTFDAVLMDLQMPLMDGYTATRTIRQQLGMRALPIVAMTANALASDRDACLAAGMNDHVAKPFDLDHLVQVLRRHAGRPLAPDTPAAAAVPLPSAVAAAAAAAGVDIEAALLRLGGKRGIYQRMLATFVADLAAMPAQLQAAHADVPEALRRLHSLRGLAASLGAAALAAAVAAAEKQLAGAAAPAQAGAAIDGACAAVDRAVPGLNALLQALQAAPAAARQVAGPVDPEAFGRALRSLALHLGNADMAAIDAMDALRSGFATGPVEPLQAMEEAIAGLDFEHALSLCNELIARTATATVEGERA